MTLPPQNLGRGFYAYISDDSNTYQIGTTAENGTNVNDATPVPAGTNPSYPRGWKMRHVYGLSEAGNRTKVPIFDPTNGLWLGTTTTFSKNGVSYTVEGKAGEDRFNKGG